MIKHSMHILKYVWDVFVKSNGVILAEEKEQTFLMLS